MYGTHYEQIVATQSFTGKERDPETEKAGRRKRGQTGEELFLVDTILAVGHMAKRKRSESR